MNIEELKKKLVATTTPELTPKPEPTTSRGPTNQTMIVRQNCLAHADVLIALECVPGKQLTPEQLDRYYAYAERCERWVLR